MLCFTIYIIAEKAGKTRGGGPFRTLIIKLTIRPYPDIPIEIQGIFRGALALIWERRKTMPRYIKKTWAGDVYEAKEYFSPRQRGKTYKRGMKENLSPEEVQEYNLTETRKRCARMINANFRAGDLFLTMMHREKVGIEEALRKLRNFIKRLKRRRKRMGLEPLKYIYVTETGKKGREHHHMVINAMDISIKELSEIWGHGRMMVSRLEPGGDYTGLAFYITKENYKEYGRRWNGSRNLEKPKEKIIEVTKSRKLHVPKGYKVLEEIQYYSEITGFTRYIKALRIGGTDYGEGFTQGREPHIQHTDREG